MASGARSPRRTHRASHWLVAVLVGMALLVTVQVLSGPPAEPSPSPSGGPIASDRASGSPRLGTPHPSVTPFQRRPSGYFVTPDELRRRSALAEEGVEPHRSAIEGLLAAATDAMEEQAEPRNPITHRRGRFLEDSRNAYTLALAAVVTENDDYARHSAEVILSWVDSTDATSDTCADAGGSECLTSLLLSRNAPAFVFAADLLEHEGAFSAADRRQFEGWLSDVILPAASERTNNWGDAGTFMRMAVSDYLGDEAAFSDAVEDWRALMDLVTAEGEIPEESRRKKLGLLYTQGALSYKAASALIAQRRGIDLWEYEGALGGSLKDIADLVARYWQEPETWPWHDRPIDMPEVDPVWEILYQRWPEPEYAALFETDRPLGPTNPSAVIWTTVTNGEAIEAGSD